MEHIKESNGNMTLVIDHWSMDIGHSSMVSWFTLAEFYQFLFCIKTNKQTGQSYFINEPAGNHTFLIK